VDGFLYRVGSTTNILGRPPKFFASSELHKQGNRFCSVYAVRQEDGWAIEKYAGTTSGFKGIVWSQRLWIDLDTEEAAQGARLILKERGLDHVVYTTGNRGLHIGVARDNRPSHILPGQDKEWVKANIPGADLSLYWHLHLIRLPGTIHEQTGLPKKLIDKVPGKALILPPLQPEQERTNPMGSDGRASLFSHWEIVSQLTEDKSQSRHGQLVRLALTLKEIGKVSFDEASWLCREVNRGFEEPKEELEIDRIVRWAYTK
jgi:hypothetical protein